MPMMKGRRMPLNIHRKSMRASSAPIQNAA
jgi:hypothetical protein